MDLSVIVDSLLPGPDSRLERVSEASQALVQRAVDAPGGEVLWKALHGNEWLGHPVHAIIITLPVGAWSVTSWYDLRAALSSDPKHDAAADGSLRVGLVGSGLAAVTGLAQYLDTRGTARRETTVHSALNTVALALYLGSWAARKKDRRALGRRLATLGVLTVSASGYLGGDLSYRHGVGMRPQALRAPQQEAQKTSSRRLFASGSVHS